MGASQLLLRRRSGSFPIAAQEEEWELPKARPARARRGSNIEDEGAR